MSQQSSIEWTDGTWPIVQGCDYASPGCSHCYAAPLLWRLSHNPNQTISGPLKGVVAKNVAGKLHFTGKVALREDRLDWPLKWRKPMKIFVPSHGDLFHPAVPDEFIDKVFAVMALATQHTFQVLTKRADRMRAYMQRATLHGDNPDSRHPAIWRQYNALGGKWGNLPMMPLPNVWLGVSVEDQWHAEERVPDLLATPAAVRFLSCEPLLGPLTLHYIKAWDGPVIDALAGEHWHQGAGSINSVTVTGKPKLDWVIAGGESGPRARPSHPDWFRQLRDQCATAGVPYFFKQFGEYGPEEVGQNGVDTFSVVTPNGEHLTGDRAILGAPGAAVVARVGKKRAGATLDGREHREFPR